MAKTAAQNSRKTPRGKPFQKGGDPRINAGGRPKNEQSITYWLHEFGNLSPVQLADQCALFSKELKKGGDGMTMFGLIAVKALMELINNASPGVLAQVLERTEGKVALPIELKPDAVLLAKLQELGLTLNDVRSDPLAAELFALAGLASDAGNAAAGTVSGEETD